VTNPGLFGTGIPYGMSRRDLLAGGTPAAERTIVGTGIGVGVGMAGAVGAPGGMSGDGAFCFFPVVSFGGGRRGAGELRGCAIELPSLLKKSLIGLPATAEGPPARNAPTDKIRTTRPNRQPIGAAILHNAAQCSISPRDLVRTQRCGVRTA